MAISPENEHEKWKAIQISEWLCNTCFEETYMREYAKDEEQDVYIELFAGSAPLTRALIHKTNNAHFILVDNKSRAMLEEQYKDWGMKELLKRHNVTFIQFDLRILSMKDLKAWCGISARSNIKNIKIMAISIDCTTLTKAEDCNYVRHRGKEGQALTIAAQWDSKMIRTIVKVVEEIEEMVPTAQ